MIDPGGVANRSVTYVDWSEGKWHPRSFRAQDITFEFLKNLSVRCTFPNVFVSVCLLMLRCQLLLGIDLETRLLLQSIDDSVHFTSDPKVKGSLSLPS